MIVLVIIASFLVTLMIGTLLHELAHATAARIVGLRIREIHVGFGPLLLRTSFGHTPLEIRLFPGSGAVEFYPTLHWRRVADFLVVAAGPACDVLLLAAILAAGYYLPSTGHAYAIIGLALYAQIFMVASNLVPRQVDVDGGKLATDGLQMLRLLFARFGENPHRRLYEAVLQQYLPPGQPVPAFTDRSEEISWIIAAHYLKREKITPAIAASLEALLSPDLPVCEQVAILDTLVSSMLPKDDPKLYADLDRWSARAYELAPEIATLRGSRGAALIETGHPGEGLALLADAENGEEFNDCLIHAFRALGHFKLGDTEAAQQHFARAKALFKHEDWHGHDIVWTVERIGRTIGSDLKTPATWSIEAARAAIRTRTSARPEPQGTP